MMKTILAFSALAFAFAPLQAAPRSGSWQIGNDAFHIHYDDLDMSTGAGRAALLERVGKVLARLCAEPLRRDEQQCVDESLARMANRDIRRALADREAMAGR